MNLPPEKPNDEERAVAPLPRRGARWEEAEYAQLADEIRSGLTVVEIAKAHGRPPGGIIAACNRLLPRELREPNRAHAPTTLGRYLHEHPDELHEVRHARAAKRQSRRLETITPLPKTTGQELGGEIAQLEPGDAAALSFEAVAWLEGKPRDQMILRMRVGIDDEPHTLAEIGEQLGVTRERIRQIQKRALMLLVRKARRPGSPGEALAALLHLPDPEGFDEAFAERIAALATSEFGAPADTSIPFLLCAAGVAFSSAREVASLARTAAKHRRAIATEQRRTVTAERRIATGIRRADETVCRWIEHASWPVTTTTSPDPEILRALRLTGPSEAAGSLHSYKLDREVFYESGLEHAALTVLERSTDIEWYQEQLLSIPYTWRDRPRRYYPDILAALRDGRRLLIEVKPLMNMPVALNRAKAAAGRSYAHARGWGWVTVDRKQTEWDLETHVIPVQNLLAIRTELGIHGHLDWRQVLRLRTDCRVSARDVAAFITQTGAQLVLEPRYRISVPD